MAKTPVESIGRAERIDTNYYLSGGGKNAHSGRLVVAVDYAHFGVAFFVGRQMAFMDNLSPTCVATFFPPMRSVRYVEVFIHT